VSDQVALQNNEKKVDSDDAGKEIKANSAVNKERIEKLKKAFRPTWLLDQLNGPEKTASRKK